MCGRYNLQLNDNFAKRFKIENPIPDFKSRYNIAPSEKLPVVTRDVVNQVEIMVWGMIPFWSKDGKQGVINARAETLAEKPTFRHAFKTKRCLIPATGFYEWQKVSDGKIPYHIRFKDQRTFSFAGIYNIWKSPDGKAVKTYAIITTTPNPLMEKIHNRMPVILKESDENKWLDNKIQDTVSLLPFLKPYPNNDLEAYPISTLINNPSFDQPEVLNPIR